MLKFTRTQNSQLQADPTVCEQFLEPVFLQQRVHNLQSGNQTRSRTREVRTCIHCVYPAVTYSLDLLPSFGKLSAAVFLHRPFQVVTPRPATANSGVPPPNLVP